MPRSIDHIADVASLSIMGQRESATDAGFEDLGGVLQALARTPDIAPFAGTERYRICRCLGEGGFGVVYEVEDRQLDRRVALKMLKPHAAGFGANIRRLKAEFRSVADIVHPNLVGLHELTSDGERWFFTMDLVRGCDFVEYVRGSAPDRARREQRGADPGDSTGLLSESRLRSALRQLAAGMQAMHTAGIIHRDLKPSNVLVEPEGRVVILDFGLAHAGREPTDATMSRAGAGTPQYMAPEQASGVSLTAAVDIYAMGVMLYEALTGRPPFEGDMVRIICDKSTMDPVPPSELATVPEDLERLCISMLCRDPKGRPSATDVLETLGRAPAPRRALATPSTVTALVGRDAEVGVLTDAYKQLRGGRSSVVCISGQPGVGKTALASWFVRGLTQHDDALVLPGRCHERESVPFKAFDGIADALARYLKNIPRNEAAALMPRDIHLVAQSFPVLSGLPALRDVPDRRTGQCEARELRLRTFDAIKELLGRLADKQPLVLMIDDLQWGDVDSARLLSHLLSPPEQPTIMVLTTHRSGESSQNSALQAILEALHKSKESVTSIELSPLASNAALRLATQLLGDRANDRTAAALAARAEGHPLFMAELAREQTLQEHPKTAAPSLVDVLWRRVLRCSAPARALLETLAVAGQPMGRDLCFAAAGLGSLDIDAVRTLRAEQLIRSGHGGALDVFHDRVRDAILQKADASTQRMRHLSLARTLESAGDGDPEALARHYDAAHEREKAARYAVIAGDIAMGGLAFDRAAALYQMAIDRSDDTAPIIAELYEKLGDALLNAGSTVEAGDAYLAAAARVDGDHSIRLTGQAAEHLLCVGDIDAGQRALEQALISVGESLPASYGGAKFEFMSTLLWGALGGYRFRERDPSSIPERKLLCLDVLCSAVKGLDPNDPRKAMAMGARFVRMAMRSGEPQRAARAMIFSTFCYFPYRTSRPAAIDDLLDRAEAIGERFSDHTLLGEAAAMRGFSHFVFSNWQSSWELCEHAADVLSGQCIGMANESRKARWNAAFARIRGGHFAHAQRLGDSLMVDALERADQVTQKAVCCTVLAPLRLAADDPDAAHDYVVRVGMEDRCASVLGRAESAADVAMYRGRVREAVEAWRSRWWKIDQLGIMIIPTFRITAARSLGLALVTEPQTGRDVREAARWARSIRGLRYPHAGAVHAVLRAYLAFRGDRPDRVPELLDLAANQYDEANMPLEAAATRYRYGTVVRGDEGAEHVEQAQSKLSAAGIANPERWVAMRLPPMQ